MFLDCSSIPTKPCSVVISRIMHPEAILRNQEEASRRPQNKPRIPGIPKAWLEACSDSEDPMDKETKLEDTDPLNNQVIDDNPSDPTPNKRLLWERAFLGDETREPGRALNCGSFSKQSHHAGNSNGLSQLKNSLDESNKRNFKPRWLGRRNSADEVFKETPDFEMFEDEENEDEEDEEDEDYEQGQISDRKENRPGRQTNRRCKKDPGKALSLTGKPSKLKEYRRKLCLLKNKSPIFGYGIKPSTYANSTTVTEKKPLTYHIKREAPQYEITSSGLECRLSSKIILKTKSPSVSDVNESCSVRDSEPLMWSNSSVNKRKRPTALLVRAKVDRSVVKSVDCKRYRKRSRKDVVSPYPRDPSPSLKVDDIFRPTSFQSDFFASVAVRETMDTLLNKVSMNIETEFLNLAEPNMGLTNLVYEFCRREFFNFSEFDDLKLLLDFKVISGNDMDRSRKVTRKRRKRNVEVAVEAKSCDNKEGDDKATSRTCKKSLYNDEAQRTAKPSPEMMLSPERRHRESVDSLYFGETDVEMAVAETALTYSVPQQGITPVVEELTNSRGDEDSDSDNLVICLESPVSEKKTDLVSQEEIHESLFAEPLRGLETISRLTKGDDVDLADLSPTPINLALNNVLSQLEKTRPDENNIMKPIMENIENSTTVDSGEAQPLPIVSLSSFASGTTTNDKPLSVEEQAKQFLMHPASGVSETDIRALKESILRSLLQEAATDISSEALISNVLQINNLDSVNDQNFQMPIITNVISLSKDNKENEKNALAPKPSQVPSQQNAAPSNSINAAIRPPLPLFSKPSPSLGVPTLNPNHPQTLNSTRTLTSVPPLNAASLERTIGPTPTSPNTLSTSSVSLSSKSPLNINVPSAVSHSINALRQSRYNLPPVPPRQLLNIKPSDPGDSNHRISTNTQQHIEPRNGSATTSQHPLTSHYNKNGFPMLDSDFLNPGKTNIPLNRGRNASSPKDIVNKDSANSNSSNKQRTGSEGSSRNKDFCEIVEIKHKKETNIPRPLGPEANKGGEPRKIASVEEMIRILRSEITRLDTLATEKQRELVIINCYKETFLKRLKLLLERNSNRNARLQPQPPPKASVLPIGGQPSTSTSVSIPSTSMQSIPITVPSGRSTEILKETCRVRPIVQNGTQQPAQMNSRSLASMPTIGSQLPFARDSGQTFVSKANSVDLTKEQQQQREKAAARMDYLQCMQASGSSSSAGNISSASTLSSPSTISSGVSNVPRMSDRLYNERKTVKELISDRQKLENKLSFRPYAGEHVIKSVSNPVQETQPQLEANAIMKRNLILANAFATAAYGDLALQPQQYMSGFNKPAANPSWTGSALPPVPQKLPQPLPFPKNLDATSIAAKSSSTASSLGFPNGLSQLTGMKPPAPPVTDAYNRLSNMPPSMAAGSNPLDIYRLPVGYTLWPFMANYPVLNSLAAAYSQVNRATTNQWEKEPSVNSNSEANNQSQQAAGNKIGNQNHTNSPSSSSVPTATRNPDIKVNGRYPKCNVCHQADAQFICSGCGKDWYCSVRCQHQNWQQHARICSN